MIHLTRRPAFRLAAASALVAVVAIPALAAPSETQSSQDPPVLHFVVSGAYAYSAARITVDVPLEEGARLNVNLTSPAGSTENLTMEQDGKRFSWTGQLREAGAWRAEATLSGVDAPQSANASVSLEAGTPTCSLNISAPEQATHYLEAEFVVDACGSSAVTGEIATRYITVLRDGVQISTLDASAQCERRFILQGGGSYEASVTIADDRGVTATCSSTNLGVDALYPRYWPIVDFATGTYKSERTDIVPSPDASWLSGAGVGLTVPRDEAAERTNAVTIRAGGGFAHNFWTGSSVDIMLTRHTPGGFFGLGGGAWGIGDNDILDGAVFGTAGINLPNYTGAGQMQAFAEFRLFARHISAPQDNFSGLVGIRLNFKRTHELRAR
ncbi:MAG: hypothetical protein OYK82_06340 [Gammaproteobacteria bacterium]|nr:hypothetical protein [Gammaproteobacteria bacterium]